MHLGHLLFVAIIGFLAGSDVAVALSDSEMVAFAKRGNTADREDFPVDHDNKRILRTRSESEEEDNSDDPVSGTNAGNSADEEERDFVISTIDRPEYWRWFRAGMTPYDVQQVLGLTGVRRLWKPIKRRVYDGYTVFYSEKCHKAKYRAFCKAHAGV